jgi:hypothetical protein
MCYDKRFLKLWAKQKVQKREPIKSEIERVLADVKPIHPASEGESTRRKEVERPFEEIV